MEPWCDEWPREYKKSFRRKVFEGVIVVYAGFAIALAGVIAETITIPHAAKRANRKKGRQNEGR